MSEPGKPNQRSGSRDPEGGVVVTAAAADGGRSREPESLPSSIAWGSPLPRGAG